MSKSKAAVLAKLIRELNHAIAAHNRAYLDRNKIAGVLIKELDLDLAESEISTILRIAHERLGGLSLDIHG